MRFAKKFYEDYAAEMLESPFPEGIRKWRFWTRTNLSLMRKIGEKRGYIVQQEKPVRIDMTWFDPEYFEPAVAIEYETDKKGILSSELRNLACSSAELKVLVTYVEQEEMSFYLKEIAKRWKNRSERVRNDELLVMFIVYHKEKGKRLFLYFSGYILYYQKGELTSHQLEPFMV